MLSSDEKPYRCIADSGGTTQRAGRLLRPDRVMNLRRNHGVPLHVAGSNGRWTLTTRTMAAEELSTSINVEVVYQGRQPVQCSVITGDEAAAVTAEVETDEEGGIVSPSSGSTQAQ